MKFSAVKITAAAVAVFMFLAVVPSAAKKVKYRDVQNVSFEGDQVDGVVRNPNGSYLTQKRGVEFLPLYKMPKAFEQNIKESVDYLR